MTGRGYLKNIPIYSMYGIFTNIYPINDPNVGKYTIHGAYGIDKQLTKQSIYMIQLISLVFFIFSVGVPAFLKRCQHTTSWIYNGVKTTTSAQKLQACDSRSAALEKIFQSHVFPQCWVSCTWASGKMMINSDIDIIAKSRSLWSCPIWGHRGSSVS